MWKISVRGTFLFIILNHSCMWQWCTSVAAFYSRHRIPDLQWAFYGMLGGLWIVIHTKIQLFNYHLHLFNCSSNLAIGLQYHMQNFTTYIVNLMKQEKLFASQGGPIILSQASIAIFWQLFFNMLVYFVLGIYMIQ